MTDLLPLIRPLPGGDIDIVGDIHGELGALEDLLRLLGYDGEGAHPAGRRLVFIGDLCDRGPESPGVIALVRRLVEAGRAECLLGNHELNVLRGAIKEGNGWFFDPDHDQAEGKFLTSRAVPPGERDGIRDFFGCLPLVLERADLRLVHAAWDEAAIRQLRLMRRPRLPTRELYRVYADRAKEIVKETGLGERAAGDWREYGARLTDPDASIPLLEGLGRLDAHYQMANPVRIVTSGPEALATQPFFASGKWRMLERVKWWNRYTHAIPVMMGHYWRWPTPGARAQFTRGEHDLFDGAAPDVWVGARHNVYCLDFGVGARYKERALGRTSGFETRLGAVRWPEREVVFDDGTRRPLS